MDNVYFKKIIIIASILGVLLLFFLSKTYDPPLLDLTEDNSMFLEKVVMVCGTIKNLEKNKNNLFFEVCDKSKCLSSVYFNIGNKENKYLTNNFLNSKKVCLEGRYTTYNSNPELIIFKIDKK